MDAEVLAEARENALVDLQSTNEWCTIRRIETIDLPSGGQEEVPVDHGPYPCRVQQNLQPVEREGGNQVIARTFWWVVLPWDVIEMDKNDVLLVLGEDGETREYQIIELNQGRTSKITTQVYVASNE